MVAKTYGLKCIPFLFHTLVIIKINWLRLRRNLLTSVCKYAAFYRYVWAYTASKDSPNVSLEAAIDILFFQLW